MPQLFPLTPEATGTTIDVIFVHGLGSASPATWTKDGTFWLKDLILKEIPKARIFDYQYDIKVVIKKGNDPWSWVYEPAEELHRLVEKQKEDQSNNAHHIMLVAHGLGGLVCAQAIAKGGSSRLSSHVRFIAFFGTPITNFQDVRWSKLATKQVPVENSGTLQQIGQSFTAFLHNRAAGPEKVSFHSFYEAEGSGSRPVVPQKSSCLDRDNSNEILAKHSDICRLGRGSKEYEVVSRLLKRWAKLIELPGISSPVSNYHSIFSGNFLSSPAVVHLEAGASAQGGPITMRDNNPFHSHRDQDPES